MSDKRSPHDADLPWPVARGELEDLEALELVRDETGKLAWQNITPPGRDTYRDWLPRRGKGTPPPPPPDDVADVGLDDPLAGLFTSEARSSATRKPLQPLEAPAAPALEEREGPSQTQVLASPAEPLTELPLQPQSVSTVAAAAPSIESPVGSGVEPPDASVPLPQSSPAASIPSSATAVAAPPRLSMAIAPTEDQPPLHISLPPAAPQPRTRAERLALLGAGALIGAMVTIVIGVAWRPNERPAPVAAERPAPAPLEVPPVPSAPPAVPVPTSQRATVDAPAAPPAATDIAAVPASPPAQVAATAPSTRAESAARRPAREPSATATATRPAVSPAPIDAPPEVLVTVDRFAAAYNRMDASATQAVWPAADRQALVTTFTALREQRLTLSRCRGTMQGDTAIVLCRGTLRYRPRVGNHDTRIREGNWRFTMLQRADDWVVDGVESPDGQ